MTLGSGARLVVSLLALALVVAVIGITTTEARLVQARPDNPWTVPDPLSGFPVNLSGRAIYEGSPTLADLDGDEKLDIVVGGSDPSNPTCLGRLYAVKSNGTILWDIQTRAPIQSTPAVDDIDGDGTQEVVVGLGYPNSEKCANGGLLAVNGLTGAQEWLFDTQDWNGHKQNGFTDAVFPRPPSLKFPAMAARGLHSDRTISVSICWTAAGIHCGRGGTPIVVGGRGIITRTRSGPRPPLPTWMATEPSRSSPGPTSRRATATAIHREGIYTSLT